MVALRSGLMAAAPHRALQAKLPAPGTDAGKVALEAPSMPSLIRYMPLTALAGGKACRLENAVN